MIAAERWWERTELAGATGRGICVAVVDSGWDRANPNQRVRAGVSFVVTDEEGSPGDFADDHDRIGHGTACAELVLRVAPGAEILPVRVFGTRLATAPETLAAALDWSIDHGAHVVNLSLGTRLHQAVPALYRICERAARSGVVIVAAAASGPAFSYPAVFANVLAVAAGGRGAPYGFRYHDDAIIEFDASGAPENPIGLGGKPLAGRGPSFAAPIISGTVALIRELHPQMPLARVREKLAELAAVQARQRCAG